MQFTQIISKKSLNGKISYKLIKVFVFVFLISYTVYELYTNPYWSKDFFYKIYWHVEQHYLLAALVVFLLPINWGLESLKWQIMVNRFTCVSFSEAYKGVLTGVAMGFATPHGLGDYFGRILQLKYKDRDELVGSVFLSRVSQFIITILFGGLSLVYFLAVHSVWPTFDLSIYLLAAVFFAFMVLVWYFRKLIVDFIFNIWIIKKYFGRISEYSGKDFLTVLLLSLIRYLTFSLQFYLLLELFDISGAWYHLLLGINLVFLAKSVVPTLFDLGVREYAAYFFFRGLGINDTLVIQASIVLWFINVLLPSVIGMFLVFNLKLKAKVRDNS